jgi:demethylmenaquinone methyltransferase/2-methoxy-6-polyprenyl-1,4-benzoquinol methylase
MSPVATEQREALTAAAGGAAKRTYVRRIFSEIAPRYDLLNHLLSFNVDKRWRRTAIDALGWERAPDGAYVDLCAGTLDVATELARRPGFRGVVVGADFAEPMLRAGRPKASRLPVLPVVADALQLPLAEGRGAGAVVAFGVRNLSDLDAGLREARRVLADGARLVILEFSTPRFRLLRALYRLYFHAVLPLVGRLVSGHPTAYRYLPASVSSFPSEAELARRMERAGFVRVTWRRLTFGVAALHVGERA